MKKLRIISRNSALALKQADIVKSAINNLFPDVELDIIGITTKADELLETSLNKIGGKGLFVKELQQYLLDGKADIAVHSLKDVPPITLSEFTIAAVLKREDARDCFVSNKYKTLKDMPDGSIVGTSSLRRIALLQKYYPLLTFKLLRGNVITRVNKLDANEYDGIILASAGLIRLGLSDTINEYLPIEDFIPAIGQGALAVEILSTRLDLLLLMAQLDDNDTYICTESEREIGKILGVDCSVPIGVHSYVSQNDTLNIMAFIGNVNTKQSISTTIQGNKADYISLALNMVHNLTSYHLEKILGHKIALPVLFANEGTI